MAGLKNTLSGRSDLQRRVKKSKARLELSEHPSSLMDIPNTQEGTHNLLPSFSSSYHAPSSLAVPMKCNISKHSKHTSVQTSFEVPPFTDISLCLNHHRHSSKFSLTLPLIRRVCAKPNKQELCTLKGLWKKLPEFTAARSSPRMSEPLNSSQGR